MTIPIPLLLPPSSLTSNPSHRPLLSHLQRLLNASYNATHTLHPSLFGTNFVRLPSPSDISALPLPHGFTVLLVDVDPHTREGTVVATGSVKDFGDVEPGAYVERSRDSRAKEWGAREREREEVEDAGREGDDGEKEIGAIVLGNEAGAEQVKKFEITGFGVAVGEGKRGLGARVLALIEEVVERGWYGVWLEERVREGEFVVEDVRIGGVRVEGVDLRKLEGIGSNDGGKPGQVEKRPDVVLMCVRELGTEAYYAKRGYRTVADGTIPTGMWGCKKDCTWVYMEKAA
ncbi:hypothetical protein B9Z65_1006 [Elsinoe australis]|uniref:Uncharacterized protein n=1 Tax=Elsinoe australis TaxID=40998 RepID=A0A2P8AI01_9PEZI|nr:hypothetical protein B9Z65_1006 [Elsinoe australis]